MHEAPLDPMLGPAELRIGISLANREPGDLVRSKLLMHKRPTVQGFFRVNDGGERFILDRGELRRVLGSGARFRDHDGDRLADMARLVDGEQRLARVQDAMRYA